MQWLFHRKLIFYLSFTNFAPRDMMSVWFFANSVLCGIHKPPEHLIILLHKPYLVFKPIHEGSKFWKSFTWFMDGPFHWFGWKAGREGEWEFHWTKSEPATFLVNQIVAKLQLQLYSQCYMEPLYNLSFYLIIYYLRWKKSVKTPFYVVIINGLWFIFDFAAILS